MRLNAGVIAKHCGNGDHSRIEPAELGKFERHEPEMEVKHD